MGVKQPERETAQDNVDLYIHSRIRLNGIVLSWLRPVSTLHPKRKKKAITVTGRGGL
jgi:hypothetical protein